MSPQDNVETHNNMPRGRCIGSKLLLRRVFPGMFGFTNPRKSYPLNSGTPPWDTVWCLWCMMAQPIHWAAFLRLWSTGRLTAHGFPYWKPTPHKTASGQILMKQIPRWQSWTRLGQWIKTHVSLKRKLDLVQLSPHPHDMCVKRWRNESPRVKVKLLRRTLTKVRESKNSLCFGKEKMLIWFLSKGKKAFWGVPFLSSFPWEGHREKKSI